MRTFYNKGREVHMKLGDGRNIPVATAHSETRAEMIVGVLQRKENPPPTGNELTKREFMQQYALNRALTKDTMNGITVMASASKAWDKLAELTDDRLEEVAP